MTGEPIELLPCPFCGSANVADFFAVTGNPYIGCADCDAQGGSFLTKKEAVEAWNTRTPSAPGTPPTSEREGDFGDLVDMLSSVEMQEGVSVFDHSPEEIGLEVMERHAAVLSALLAASPNQDTQRG
jgi:Lar family restriction alleviation protein